jgi:hypothetical protein
VRCYKKICSQLRLQQLLERVCNNLHAGSDESLQIPDISKDLSYITAENMFNMGIMLVYKILHVNTKYSYALHSHIHTLHKLFDGKRPLSIIEALN